MKNGEPIWGVIYVPDKQILYYGGEEEGSYKVEKVKLKERGKRKRRKEKKKGRRRREGGQEGARGRRQAGNIYGLP